MALFYVAGNGGVFFVLPLLAKGLTGDLMLVGLLVAVPNFVSMFLDVPVGGFSDYVGRRRLLCLGLVLMGFLGLMLPSITSFFSFVLFMVVFGIANQLILISGRAFLMDVAPQGKTSEYFGILESLAQIGFAVGPVVAGMLIADKLDVGIFNVGVFYLVMCSIALVIVLALKETVKCEKFAESVKKLIKKDRLISRELIDFQGLGVGGLVVLFSTFIIVFIDGVVWTFEPLYTTLGIDTATVGLILSMFVLPFIFFEVPAGILADRFGKIRIFILGLVVAGIFLIVFGSARTPLLLAASAFMATSGLALARPALSGFLTDISASKERGGIVGVWNVAEDFAYVTSPIAGGVIAELYGIGTTFMLVGILLLVSIPLMYLAVKKSGFCA
jgi:MFS family permease